MLHFLAVSQPEHIECVALLARHIWEEYYPPITGLEQTRYMLAHYQSASAIAAQLTQDYYYFLVQDATDFIGYFALGYVPDSGAVQLSKLYLTQHRRGQGHGKALLKFIEHWCQARGVQELWLTVNRNNLNALAFYDKAGFHNTGALVKEIGDGYIMDDYRMAKWIQQSGE